MEEGIFKRKDLEICDWQYIITHTNVNSFVIGEKVFLKSNPEHSMSVHSINENEGIITTIWYIKSNEMQLGEFMPHSILQYKYAGLLTYREKFYVSLN